MSSLKPKLSIGIPAYNEEANIKELVLRLLTQNQKNYLLKEIMVFSDGSTDNTEKIVKSLSEKFNRVKLYKIKNRLGQQVIQNMIIKKYLGNLLAIIEADTLPADKDTIDKLIRPFVVKNDDNLAISVGYAEPITPKNFFEKVMFQGTRIKVSLFKEWRNGDNVFGCGGHSAKILSKSLTDKLAWPSDVPEDAYLYFRVKQLNLKVIKIKNAKFYMRNVTNLRDMIKQGTKYISGQKSLENYFDLNYIRKEYNPPLSLIIKHTMSSFIKRPILTSLYVLEVCLNRTMTLRKHKFNALYSPYMSSKFLS